jgi:hypothetical protein
MATVRVGDVLESDTGLMRVVRKVSRYKDGDLRSVSFTVKRCSWTQRCYTLLDYTSLRLNGYKPVARVRMGSTLDWKIFKEIGSRRAPELSCCAVKEVA